MSNQARPFSYIFELDELETLLGWVDPNREVVQGEATTVEQLLRSHIALIELFNTQFVELDEAQTLLRQSIPAKLFESVQRIEKALVPEQKKI